MPDQNFGPLLAFTDVEELVLEHYKHWMHVWLPARERKLNLPTGTISRPKSYVVKQIFTALPGEERTPLVIAVSDGFTVEPERRGTGAYDAYLRFGIAAMCMATDARSLVGHYQAVLLGIALKHRSIADGMIVLNDFNDLTIEDIDDEALGRSMAAVRLELVYKVKSFVEDADPPVWTPPTDPDPIPPQTDDPEVEEVIIDVEKEEIA